MTYILKPPFINGQTPAYDWTDNSNYQPQAGEILVSDTAFHLLIEQPYGAPVYDPTLTPPLRLRTAAEKLALAKKRKEDELRDAANGWYTTNVRAFEGASVMYKIDRGQALTVEEQAIRDSMTANYTTLRSKITQVRNATTEAQVVAVTW